MLELCDSLLLQKWARLTHAKRLPPRGFVQAGLSGTGASGGPGGSQSKLLAGGGGSVYLAGRASSASRKQAALPMQRRCFAASGRQRFQRDASSLPGGGSFRCGKNTAMPLQQRVKPHAGQLPGGKLRLGAPLVEKARIVRLFVASSGAERLPRLRAAVGERLREFDP